MIRSLKLGLLFAVGALFAPHASAQNDEIQYSSGQPGYSSYEIGAEAPIRDGLPPEYFNQLYIPPSGFTPAIRLNSTLTQPLMDFQNRQSDKELLLIDPAFSGGQETTGLTIGAQFRGSAMVGRTNTTNKFSYLGRFPTDFSGDSVTDARLLQANQVVWDVFLHGLTAIWKRCFRTCSRFLITSRAAYRCVRPMWCSAI